MAEAGKEKMNSRQENTGSQGTQPKGPMGKGPRGPKPKIKNPGKLFARLMNRTVLSIAPVSLKDSMK